MQSTSIYTIGYGNRKIETFTSILYQYNITTVVDVRSKPHSRYQPAYNKSAFSKHLNESGISYLFKGDALGGRPSNELLYSNGVLNYGLVEMTKQYRDALVDLVTLTSYGERVCLLCAELDENSCHRKRLVGASLYKMGISVIHIDKAGQLKPHINDNPILDMFTF